ncbi:hypothetical protein N7509_007490 [Penicillium cosmopolitanum]|uniref:Uncharacterized protein n=1 Tax=Penicillium cosmopolitanum TaxID=1131564 RepID=A0A9X0B8E3_9EURO|nr:uncharacterized protein N7509_007490 [Penicillium cosmopolitanum]KAJ5392000.1 hypothetical protein N7509_007490 [Penicillium cosmopolitanum]
MPLADPSPALRRAAPDSSATLPEPDLVLSPTGFLPTPADPVSQDSTHGVPPQPASTSPSCSSYLHFSSQEEEYL